MKIYLDAMGGDNAPLAPVEGAKEALGMYPDLQIELAGPIETVQKTVDEVFGEGDAQLRSRLTPAILTYDGIQYQYMGPGAFTDEELNWAQEHLRILSGFYGILRPLDGVTPYRLEMQAKLSVGGARDLYDFWGDAPAKQLFAETDCILNLASKEYSQCVEKYLPADKRMITCVFGEEKDGKVIEKGTLCKMARGEMVRYLAVNQITHPEEAKRFTGLNFRFAPERSNESTYVFIPSGAA